MAAGTISPTTGRLRLGLSLPNMAPPGELVDLGVRAEVAGWDGVFLWDHVHGDPEQPLPVEDPWVVLGAMAVRTERVRLGTTITAVPRRRPQELARQVVTLDRLSGGRAVLGVGLGEPPEEHTAYGDSAEPRVLGARLDEGLEVLDALWTGEPVHHRGAAFTVDGARFVPRAVQEPRVPVWTSCRAQNTATLSRAARWDGVLLAELGPEGSIDPVSVERVSAARDSVAERRGSLQGFDIVVTLPSRPDDETTATYAAAGATWVLVTGWLDQLHALVAEV